MLESRSSGGAALLSAGLLLFAACRIGTELPGDEAGSLELAEAEGIASALVRAALEPTVFSDQQAAFTHSHGTVATHTHPVAGPYLHDVEIVDGPLPSHHNLFSVELAVDVPCDAGGSLLLEAAATGEGNPLVQLGKVDYELGQSPVDCVLVLADAGDARMALESPPYVTGTAHAEYAGVASAVVSAALTGGIAWEGEAKAGECAIDLQLEATGPSVLEITEVPVTGTVCDLAIDLSVVFPR